MNDTKPRKRHPVRNALITATLLGGAGYYALNKSDDAAPATIPQPMAPPRVVIEQPEALSSRFYIVTSNTELRSLSSPGESRGILAAGSCIDPDTSFSQNAGSAFVKVTAWINNGPYSGEVSKRTLKPAPASFGENDCAATFKP